MEKLKIAKVAVEKTAFSFDKLYSYGIPERFRSILRPGCRVVVPFGGGNRKRQGLVMELEELSAPEPGTAPKPLKELSALIDQEPLLDGEMLDLLDTLRRTTFCTYYDALKVLVPAGVGVRLKTLCTLDGHVPIPEPLSCEEQKVLTYLKGKKKPADLDAMLSELDLPGQASVQRLADQGVIILAEAVQQKAADGRITMAKLASPYEDGSERLPARLSQGQKAVLSVLKENGCASVKELCYYAGVTPAVVKNLEKKEIVELFGRQIFRSPFQGSDPYKRAVSRRETDSGQNPGLDREGNAEGAESQPVRQPLILTVAQQRAYEQLRQIWKEECSNVPDRKKSASALLYGVTGSGKTQVFLRLIQEVRTAGKGVIVLVPEISLTPQTVELFQMEFGEKVAVLHSGLTMVERADEFKRIRQGLADVVVGTRSAVFAPLKDIGLIVIDEEQEHTYRSEQTPKFHAREVAKYRCRVHGALLLLSSATPSVETFYQAQKGRCHLVEMPQRYQGRQLPQVQIVDMSHEYGTEISPELARELTRNMAAGEQSILLMNRRGYNTVVKCQNCGEAVTCPNCSVALTYHSANGRLMCHYCGYSKGVEDKCGFCGSDVIQYRGSGTQKIEELLCSVFPNANILRMDMDTTMSRFAHEKKFAAFAAGEYQVMIGTQMVAKGLNFPNVTLVGVLNADQYLFAQDFRGCEKTFSLITQVIGRCGRGERPGRAVVQTTSPDHPVIRQAAQQDYRGFYADEIKARRLGLYPPFCDLCFVAFSSEEQQLVRQAAIRFSDGFRRLAKQEYQEIPLRMLEPCAPSVEKVAGRYRYHLVIKCRKSERFAQLLRRIMIWFDSDPKNKKVAFSIDMNYDGTL